MANNRIRIFLMLSTAIVLICFLSACSTFGTAKKGGDTDAFAANITYDVADSAKISKVSYFFKDYKGASRLHMEVAIMNIASETKRFRVNIFLPEGPSGGGLYPRKVKGDVKGVAAGKEHTRVFPMYFDKLPSGFMLVVKELG